MKPKKHTFFVLLFFMLYGSFNTLLNLVIKMNAPRYFILENDDNNLSLLLYILNDIGEYSYKVFNRTSELLGALKNDTPSIILCKVSIAGCDVREVCNSNLVNQPMIFLSDLYQSEERRSCFLESEHPYISAPFYPEKLIPHIHQIL